MATEHQWKIYTDDTFEGKLTGNAMHARECLETPLEADAILDLLYENVGYFGDPYYAALTEPVEMRVAEYFAHRAVS